jgi:hypothetical protein
MAKDISTAVQETLQLKNIHHSSHIGCVYINTANDRIELYCWINVSDVQGISDSDDNAFFEVVTQEKIAKTPILWM